jgi:DNA-binding transcriptional ArsR family regulator
MPNPDEQPPKRQATLKPHPARDQILEVMRSYGEPISPTRLAKVTGATLGSVAYHMRMLVTAGVVELADEGRVRGAVEHFYALAPDGTEAQLVDPIMTLLGLCGALTVPTEDGGYPQQTELDAKGRAELQHMLDRLRPRVQRVAATATKRVVARTP